MPRGMLSCARRTAGATDRSATCPTFCAGRRHGLQRHQGHSRPAQGHAPPRRGHGGRRGDAAYARSPERWKAFLRPAKRVKVGERISFGHTGNLCLLGTLNATVIEKGEGGEALLEFDLSGPVARRGAARGRPRAAAALHRLQARRRRARPDRLPDDLCPRGGRRRGADGRAALHARTDGAARRARDRAPFRHAACRGGNLPAGQGGGYRDHRMHAESAMSTPATAEALNAARARGGRIVAVGTTSLGCWKARPTRMARCMPWSGATDIFITPGYRFRPSTC
jgi:S-adenosylmethionine:tRNA ribosyltransferase-isomerase